MSLDREIERVERAARGAAKEAIDDAFERHDREWAEATRPRGAAHSSIERLRRSSYYTILGIRPTTDPRAIAEAHVARRRSAEGAELTLIEEAYSVLSKPAVCRAYFACDVDPAS